MAKFQDLSNMRFSKLVVVERAPNYNGDTMWLCKCDCGAYSVVPAYRLKSGETKSCGCLNRLSIQVEAGNHYGTLEALCLSPKRKGGKRYWLCRCECGNLKYIAEHSLQTGVTRSCGCKKNELIGEKLRKHGETGTRLFNIWRGMKQRCYDKHHSNYPGYGGRGITICDEWVNSYESFRDWAKENGYNDQASIDRIDVNGNYEPSNCRWVGIAVQNSNRRDNHLIEYKGQIQTLAEVCRATGISHSTVLSRIKRGWPEKDWFKPVDKARWPKNRRAS